ncbi:hypothetical protein ColLi_00389 [Colletotrichum liriopes]|uniref:Uncharacterized protein n=1 Tax=Colletotrichum liriopes TaxID=708192 RepID=A0AA37GAY2_9PEZI|nr:hypothetical protein ColLi_00389 [Colletotrichum liriopes]
MDGRTETQPHTWARPFEGIKKVKAGGDISAALCKAWRQLGLEYPYITVKPDGITKVYRQLQDTDLDGLGGWLAETFFVIKSTSLVDDAVREARGPDDLPRLHHFPGTSQVLFICSHWRIDAIGSCMLLEFLTLGTRLERQATTSLAARSYGLRS